MVEIREWTAIDAAVLLREPTSADDKYSRGVLGVRTGSPEYPGAAVLGVEAAWRTGLGMVRYLGPDRAGDLVLQRRPETVTRPGRVQAWLIGSGTDPNSRAAAETAELRGILGGDAPVVVDAGALDLLPDARAPRIATPHDREHERMRAAWGLAPAGADRVAAVRETAAATGAVVLLKGATTLIAAPDGEAVSVAAGTPWLATAGTGDVLGGVLGALVAGHAAVRMPASSDLVTLAATAALLHGEAARLLGPGPLVAADLAVAVSRAVTRVSEAGRAETGRAAAGPAAADRAGAAG